MVRRSTARMRLQTSTAEVSAPPLSVRDSTHLTEKEWSLLKQARLPRDVQVEAWTAAGTNRQLAYATHGVFRYFGKFPPTLAAHLIERYTTPGDNVLDPMVGSGTTAVECALRERRVVARDVSPLSILLTKVKTTFVDGAGAFRALERVERRYQRGVAHPEVHPVGLRNPGHWFLPATARSLSRLRSAIEEEAPGAERDLLLVSFAATVRRVSRATTQQGRLFLDVATALEDAWPTFEARAKQAILAVSAFTTPKTPVIVEQRSVLSTAATANEQHLVIAHPPYFNNYKYSGVNSLELAWLGADHNLVRKQEIREAFKIGDPAKVSEYVDDMQTAVTHMLHELAPGGRLALMIGDTTLRGEYVPTTQMLLSRLTGLPARLELVALRVPQFTEATWVASQRRTGAKVGVTLCDFVLVLRKT